MLIEVKADRQKAKSLINTAKITMERLKETNKEKYPSNTLTDYYDIMRELMEALTSLGGIKFKGDGAHIEIIDYICNEHSLGESNRQFIQEMRDYRNRISYEGFNIKEDYIKINSKRIEKIINKLSNLVNKKLKQDI